MTLPDDLVGMVELQVHLGEAWTFDAADHNRRGLQRDGHAGGHQQRALQDRHKAADQVRAHNIREDYERGGKVLQQGQLHRAEGSQATKGPEGRSASCQKLNGDNPKD